MGGNKDIMVKSSDFKDDSKITELGKVLSVLSISPQFGKMLLRGNKQNVLIYT